MVCFDTFTILLCLNCIDNQLNEYHYSLWYFISYIMHVTTAITYLIRIYTYIYGKHTPCKSPFACYKLHVPHMCVTVIH